MEAIYIYSPSENKMITGEFLITDRKVVKGSRATFHFFKPVNPDAAELVDVIQPADSCGMIGWYMLKNRRQHNIMLEDRPYDGKRELYKLQTV